MLNSNELINKVKNYNKFLNPERLDKAYNFAVNAHKSQKRASGDPYSVHPIEVAKRVNFKHGSEAMTAAALLHDVLEDTKVTHSELRLFLHNTFLSNSAEDVLAWVVELTDVYTHKDFPNYNRKERKRSLYTKIIEKILKENGIVHLKTDSEFFFGYTIGIVSQIGEVIYAHNNIYSNSNAPKEAIAIQTFYEKIFINQNKPIAYMKFRL